MDIIDAIPETPQLTTPRTQNPLDRSIMLYRNFKTEYPITQHQIENAPSYVLDALAFQGNNGVPIIGTEIRLHGVSTHIGLERVGNNLQQVLA